MSVHILSIIILFLLGGLAEIGGCYLIWKWLREGKPCYFGAIGGIVLAFYGVFATLQSFLSYERVYSAYGGVFTFLFIGVGELIKRL